MTRSLWKLPFSKEVLFFKVFTNDKEKKTITLFLKSSTIFPAFVGHTFLVYNGKKFINMQVQLHMVGFRFGDFINTKKKCIK